MKNLKLLISFLIFSAAVDAQNVGINENGASADESAILDVSSTNKGALLPRMTESNRDAIGSPAEGLLIYQTDNDPGYYFYNGSGWEKLEGEEGWKLAGNNGTTTTTNFIGTIDNEDLKIKTNNTDALELKASNQQVNVPYRLKIGKSGDSYPTLGGSLLVGEGAPDIFTGGISIYSSITSGQHPFQGGIRIHNATTGTGSGGGALLALRGDNFSMGSLGADMLFETSGTEKMRLANNGRLGIGDFSTTGPEQLLHLRGTALNILLENNSATGVKFAINSTNAGNFRINNSSAGTTLFDMNSAGNIRLPSYANGALVVDGSGNVTDVSYNSTYGTGNDAGSNNALVQRGADGVIAARGFRARSGINGSGGNSFNINWTGAGAELWIDNVTVGTITLTSDRRLKKEIKPFEFSGLEAVKALRPVTFKYKNIHNSIFSGSDEQFIGFIADELQTVIPSAVLGDKDALTKNGNIQPQTLRLAPIISVLTKAIQEQQTQIESLERQNTKYKETIRILQEEMNQYSSLAKDVEQLKLVLLQSSTNEK